MRQKEFQQIYDDPTIGWNIQSTIAKAYPKVGLTLPWITLCEKLVKPVPNLSIVCWKFPENGVLKLNTDGNYCPASGKSGMGGVLRDDRGNLILAFSSPSSCICSTEAEAKAASYGLSLCLLKNLKNFTIEIDSLVLFQMIVNNQQSKYKLNFIF